MVVRPTSLISEQILMILPARLRIIRLEASRETSMALVRLVRSTSPCAQVHFFEADPALDAGVVNEHIHAALGVENIKRLCDFGLVGNVEARFLGA